ncbi:MAG TPA: cyclase family protein [Nanoarchaeota archaeon]|nr:cyclase family protein [Nanoarchaeota archaeon]
MIYDISLELSGETIAYPDNPEIKIRTAKSIPGSGANVSEIKMGSHSGTHADSLRHIENTGNAVEKLPLDSFYGNAKVLDLTACSSCILAADLQALDIRAGDIILLKTRNSLRGFKQFYADFIYLSEEGAGYLAKKGIKTLGIDSLSVQKFHSGNQNVHNLILSSMTLFEGLDLSKVPPGEYIFAGLPLRIKGCDSAPARAILISRP